jgi:KDO2-lipid IV(A) lauroyltransferase
MNYFLRPFFNITLSVICFFLKLIGHRNLYYLAKVLSFVCFDLFSIRKKIILKNLDIAFPSSSQKEKLKIGRASFEAFILMGLEFLISDTLYPKFKIHLKEDYPGQVKSFQGKAFYFLCIHMGNWEVLSSSAQKNFNLPVHIISKPIGGPLMNEWVQKRRHSLGIKVINRGGPRNATYQIFDILKKKEAVGFVVDQRRGETYPIPFFSQKAYTNVSLIKLYLKKPAPVVPAYIRRLNLNEFEVIFKNELEIERKENESMDECVMRNGLKMNQVVEEMIRENPKEYHWLHNRWKGFY